MKEVSSINFNLLTYLDAGGTDETPEPVPGAEIRLALGEPIYTPDKTIRYETHSFFMSANSLRQAAQMFLGIADEIEKANGE